MYEYEKPSTIEERKEQIIEEKTQESEKVWERFEITKRDKIFLSD